MKLGHCFSSLGVTIFTVLVVGNNAVDLGDACEDDDQCGRNTICWYYPVEPGCEKGVCTCKVGYFRSVFNSFDCFERTLLPIGSKCYGTELEEYPHGAHCYAGWVQCKKQYEVARDADIRDQPRIIPNPSYCQLKNSTQSQYGAVCTDDSQCNAEHGLFCDLARLACLCFDDYVWLGSTCREAYYDMPCHSDDNCRTGGAYSAGGPGNGGACSSDTHRCVCGNGYEPHNYTEYAIGEKDGDVDLEMYTWTICIPKGSKGGKRPRGESCSVSRWSSAINSAYGMTFCDTGSACVICPEDRFNNPNATGVCRSGADSIQHSNLSVAALSAALSLMVFLFQFWTGDSGV